MGAKEIVNLRDIAVGFNRKEPVLYLKNFILSHGEKLLIAGESGAGKSVFLKMLMGVLPPDAVWFGRFKVPGNKEWMNYNEYQRIGLMQSDASAIFQDAVHSLHPYRTIHKQCPADRPLAGGTTLYQSFKLNQDDFLSRMPKNCSGGECQRLSLLFPFENAEKRKILLFDEPITDIDLISRPNIEKGILKFLEDDDLTVILVTHNIEWLEEHLNIMKHYFINNNKELINEDNSPFMLNNDSPLFFQNDKKANLDKKADTRPIFKLSIKKKFYFQKKSNFMLNPVELKIREGESLGLIGESGSGKSTLMRIAAGLFHKRYYQNHFSVDFYLDHALIPLHEMKKQKYRRIQMVFQDSSGTQATGESVKKNLSWICKLMKMKKGDQRKKFDTMCDELGKQLRLFDDSTKHEFMKTSLSDLSMGTLRRYGLMRSFLLFDIYNIETAKAPKLLLLDEVSRGLGKKDIENISNAINRYQKEFNIAIMAISHDIDFLIRICDRFRMMFHGNVLPKVMVKSDLNTAKDSTSELKKVPNPYYWDFLIGEERERLTSCVTGRQSGCIFLDYYKECPNQDKVECIHDKLKNKNEEGASICC